MNSARISIFAASILTILISSSAMGAFAPPVPPNDNFANAADISGALPVAAAGYNIGASKEGSEPNHNGDSGGASVWYKWVAPTAGPVVVNVSASFSSEVAVYTGAAVNALTPVVGGSGTFSANFTATASTAYFIAIDGQGGVTGNFQLQLATANPVINNALSVDGNVGAPFSFTLSTVTGNANFTTSTLPAGLTFTPATGGITGTPTAVGTTLVTLTATNTAGTDQKTLTININPPVPVMLNTFSIQNATVGMAFTTSVSASGNAPITFTATNLPPGLTLSGSTISGTPASAGSFFATITANNVAGTASQILPFSVAAVPAPTAPLITSALSADGNVGVSFYYTVDTLGTAPITITSGTLPAGLTLSGSTISGTPNTIGSTPVTITATNSTGMDTKTLTINISGALPPVIDTYYLSFTGTMNVAFSQSLTSSGATPVTFTALTSLPAGLTLAGSTISGTPTTSGVFHTTIKATNSAGTDTEDAIFNISPPGSTSTVPPTFTGSTTLGETVGIYFSDYPTITGSSSTYTSYSAPLPPGTSMYPYSPYIYGTPTMAGTFTNVFTATNSAGTASQTQTITVAPASPPKLPSNVIFSGTVGVQFGYSISFTGNYTTNSITIDSTTPLPAGLVVQGTQIVGTPTTAGTTSVKITAYSAAGNDTQTYSFQIAPAPTPSSPVITSPLTASGNVGESFSYNLVASTPNVILSTSTLPLGLSFSGGLITGTPVNAGTTNVTLSAANQNGSDTKTLVLTINSAIPVGIDSPLVVTGFVGVPFNYNVTINGGAYPESITSATLPTGLVISGTSIVGTPTAAGTAPVAITATTKYGVDTKSIVFNIIQPVAPIITSSLSLASNVGNYLYYTPTASGTDTIDFSFSGTLPPGLTVSSGSISGQLSSAGTSNIMVTATNAFGSDTKTLVITVNPTIPSQISSSLSVDAYVGIPFSYSTHVQNSSVVNSITAAPLPAGLSVSGSSIIGTPTAVGLTVVTLTANTASGNDTKTLLINVRNPLPPVIDPNSLFVSGNLGQNLNGYINLSSGTAPLTFTITGLPNGVSQSGYFFGGLPTSTGLTSATVTATNIAGTDKETLLIAVGPPIPPTFYTDLSPVTITVGSFFSLGLSANGTGPITFSAIPLPTGLVLTPTGIVGNPTTPGVTNVTITATGPGGTDTAIVPFTVVAPSVPAITSSLTATGFIGDIFSYTCTASGSTPVTFTADPLPAGLSLDYSGGISGTPLYAGTTNVTLIAANSAGFDTKTLAITINTPPAPTITSPLNATAAVGEYFVYYIYGNFNASPSYSATGLPPGLTINPTNGVISGTPTTAGVSNVMFSETDAGGTVTNTLVLTVNPTSAPALTSTLASTATAGLYYSYFISSTGSLPQSYDAANLPAGLVISGDEIFGTPTTAGTANITLTATNAFGSDTKQLVLTIKPAAAPKILSSATVTATLNQFFVFALDASGSQPITYTATGLPPGLTITDDIISGVPTVAGSSNVTLTATNAGGTGNQTLVITVIPPTPPTISSTLAASGNVDQSFFYQIAASGSTPLAFRSSKLPPGLYFYADSIYGTPTTVGTTNVVLTAINASGSDNKTLVITIKPPTAPTITSPLTATGSLNVPFNYSVSAVGKSPITYTITGLPAGLNSDGYYITGTPTATGTFNVTLMATNSLGSDTKTLVLTVNSTAAPAKITSALTANGNIGTAFSYTVTVTGNSPVNVHASPLPPGLTFDSNSLTISGTPAANGITNVNLTADNSIGSDAQTLVITIGTAPAITSSLLAAGSPGVAFSYTITASGSAPFTFSATPLPAGLTLNGGTISGTPSAPSVTQTTITATNGVGSDSKVLTIAIGVPTLSQIIVSPALAKTGDTLTFTATATDPNNLPLTYVWNFGDGSATASGNPVTYAYSAGGTFTVTCSVSDGGPSVSATFPVTILAPNSGGTGVPNVADGTMVTNPLNGISIQLVKSEGGVVELEINVDALVRSAFNVSTDFNSLSSVQNTVAGTHVVNKFTNAGIYVAQTTATDPASSQIKGKARKTIVIGRRETGESALVDNPPTTNLQISLSKMTAKLGLTGIASASAPKPDALTFTGTLTLPAGLDVSKSQEVWVGIGNIVDQVTVDAKGRGTSKGTLGRISKIQVKYPRLPKATTKTTSGMKAQITVTFVTSNMVNNGFDTEGVSAKPKSNTVNLQMAVLLAGVAYEFQFPATLKVAPKADSVSLSAVGTKGQ